MTKEKKEITIILKAIAAKVKSDPETWKMSEEYQKRYGVLTEDDLKRIFTI